MSLDAMVWAVKDAPLADVEEHGVLTVMADEADEAGCGVFLATATIAERALMSPKTAQRRIDDMLARGVLGVGDQSLAARHIPRRDRRPVVYDMLIPYSAYSRTAIERVNKNRAAKGQPPLTRESRPDIAPPPAPKRRADLGKSRKPDGVTCSPPDGGTASTPANGVTTSPGGLVNPNGVTSNSSRGVYKSPDPVIDPGFDPKNITPPLPPEIHSPPTAEPKGEGGRFDHQTQRQLTEATDTVLELKPGWKRSAVTAAMLAEIDGGRPPAVVARAVVNVARLADSNSPGRLKHDGPWWNLTEQAPTLVRDLPPDAPRCRRHRGQPAHTCSACLGERHGADRPEPEPEPDPAAREQARQLVRTLARQRRRARTGVPTAVGDLLSAGDAP